MGKAVSKLRAEARYHDLRFERKFIFEDTYLEDIINQVVYTSEFGFSEIYDRRGVNNIYFDDTNYKFYHQNVAGDGERKKYRLRWYGDTVSEIKNPRLEIKKKFGEVGDKYAIKLKGTRFDLQTQSAEEVRLQLIDILEEQGHGLLALDMKILFPALINRYERRYFLSACGKFRITLDYHMQFYDPNYRIFEKSEYTLENKETIFELKYKPEHDTECRKLTQRLRNRMSKNSKYVKGIDCITF